MRGKTDVLDGRCKLDERMQTDERFVLTDEVCVLDHLLQKRSIDFEASHSIRLGSVTILVFSVIRIKQLVDLLVGFEADAPVGMEDAFAERQVGSVDIFVINLHFAAWRVALFLFKIHRMGLIAGHFLNFADGDVIEVLHGFHINV